MAIEWLKTSGPLKASDLQPYPGVTLFMLFSLLLLCVHANVYTMYVWVTAGTHMPCYVCGGQRLNSGVGCLLLL